MDVEYETWLLLSLPWSNQGGGGGGLSRRVIAPQSLLLLWAWDRHLTAVSAGSPLRLLCPHLPRLALVCGRFPGQQTSMVPSRGTLPAPLQGHLTLLPTASWALLCACVTENLPFPGLPILPAELGLHLLGPPFGGRASLGIWRVMVQTCRFSHDELTWKCFYFTLFGRISLMDIKLWVDFFSPLQNFKDVKLSSGLSCFWCEMMSPVIHVTAPQKAMCLSSQCFF